MKVQYKRIILFILSGLFILSFLPYSDNTDSLVVDIFSHFLFQYSIISLVLLVVCIWKRLVFLSCLSGILFIINITAFLDFNGSAIASIPEKDTFKVYTANINKENKDLTRLIREIENVDAEVVLLMEVTSEHVKQLAQLKQGYNYNIVDPRIDASGRGGIVLSKFPVLRHNLIYLSDYGNAIFEVRLNIKQTDILFYGVHFPRPRFNKSFTLRQKKILMLAYKVADSSAPIVIAGDFNTTPFSPVFKKFLRISGLRDSRVGFGWQPSWPSFFPFLWIPIDHLLVSPEIEIHKRATGSHIGSDHFPVFAELSIIKGDHSTTDSHSLR